MYIKTKHYKTDLIQILNVDISKQSLFYSQGNKLIFKIVIKNIDDDDDDKEENNNIEIVDFITFKTSEEADMARDAVFYNLGLKQPSGNVLNLTDINNDWGKIDLDAINDETDDNVDNDEDIKDTIVKEDEEVKKDEEI